MFLFIHKMWNLSISSYLDALISNIQLLGVKGAIRNPRGIIHTQRHKSIMTNDNCTYHPAHWQENGGFLTKEIPENLNILVCWTGLHTDNNEQTSATPVQGGCGHFMSNYSWCTIQTTLKSTKHISLFSLFSQQGFPISFTTCVGAIRQWFVIYWNTVYVAEVSNMSLESN